MTNTRLSGGQKVIAPKLMGSGTTEAIFVRTERRVNRARRIETVTIVRYRPGGAEWAYDPRLVTRKTK